MPTIEQNFERIAEALEKLVAQSRASAAEKPAEPEPKTSTKHTEKPAEKPAEKPKVEKPSEKPKSSKSIEDVRTALKNYREIEGTPAMLEVLKKHGAANINELAEEHYEAVIAAVS